jgi:TetR/AcrR family transcriptional repressor of nem operon
LEEETQTVKAIDEQLNHYISLFEKALKEECKMCLCGLLAAESSNLPEVLKLEVQRFFNLNIKWLTKMFKQQNNVENNQEEAEKKAVFLISALEGAMLTSQVNNNNEMFDMTTQQIKALLKF